MATSLIPFKPIPGSTVTISATSTSGNVAIPSIAKYATSVRVTFSAGTAGARWRAGVGSGTTATSSDPLCPNPGTPFVYAEVFGIEPNSTYVAAKTDSGTCTIEFTFGFGA